MRWIRITVWNEGDCIVPKNVKQINGHLFIDTYKSNNIKIGVNNMTVIDSKMCLRWKDETW